MRKKLLEWNNLNASIVNVNLQAWNNSIVWTLGKSGSLPNY
jgi:hypothetical protein